MLPTRQGSIRLFRFVGIDVFLHWSWFLILLYQVSQGGPRTPLVWKALECLGLFGLVLMHEFGHSLACRQVGGQADQIILWPFGGVAYVSPPQRPGAILWSIAAGPLVNVALAPILSVLLFVGARLGWGEASPNAFQFLYVMWMINLGLLIFNLLPIYPLDGGQILQALLWFVLGRARSLLIATIVGFVGIAGLLGFWLFSGRSPWLLFICVFILLNCWRGLMHARRLCRLAKLPHRQGFACPDCRQPPIWGPIWRCPQCLQPFDAFETHAACPHCGAQLTAVPCPDCGSAHSLNEWNPAAVQH